MTNKKINLKKTSDKAEDFFLFGKSNYTLMIIGIVIIILGFVLMSGTDDIFSTTKLTVAPILVLLGFVIEVFAIMQKPKSN